MQFLRESWQPAIKKVVQTSLRDVDPEQWDAPPPIPSGKGAAWGEAAGRGEAPM